MLVYSSILKPTVCMCTEICCTTGEDFTILVWVSKNSWKRIREMSVITFVNSISQQRCVHLVAHLLSFCSCTTFQQQGVVRWRWSSQVTVKTGTKIHSWWLLYPRLMTAVWPARTSIYQKYWIRLCFHNQHQTLVLSWSMEFKTLETQVHLSKVLPVKFFPAIVLWWSTCCQN